MGERGHFNENEGQGQRRPVDAIAWATENAIRPFVETLSEPYNSFVAPAAESLAKNVFGSKANLHVDMGKAAEPEVLSAGWATANVSRAIAMTGIYALAEHIASKPLRLVGLGAHCIGDMAKARSLPLVAQITKGLEKGLLSKSTSLVVGASAYDGLRNERPGETHAGNFWGTAAGFTMFDVGNRFVKLPGNSLANIALYGLKRATVGAVGGLSQVGISKLVASGEMSAEELAGSAIVGGTINSLFGLPVVARQMKVNTKTSEGPTACPKLQEAVGNEANLVKIENPATHSEPSVFSQAKRIQKTGTEPVNVETGRDKKGPFENYGDFLYRGLASGEMEMDAYRVQGHPEVKVLVTKADLLSLNGKFDGTTAQGEKLTILDSMASVLDQSPDSTLAKRIVIVKSNAPETVWLRQNGHLAPDHKLTGEYKFNASAGEYEIRMYKPQSHDEILKTYMHEFVHIAEQKHKELFRMTKLARLVEGDRGFEHSGCNDMHDYSSSVLLGDYLLGSHPINAVQVFSKAPIQSMTALLCLERVLPDAAPASQARSLIKVAKENYLELVTDKLFELTRHDNADMARILIDFLKD